MPAELPELDDTTPMTLEEKKERQRLHVRRSYYRKLVISNTKIVVSPPFPD